MKRHLSDLQIAAWMTGERTAGEQAHVRECAECGAEVARLESAVAAFRGSVREWSAGAAGRPSRARSRAPHALRLVFATALLAILAGVPLYRTAERQRQAAQARADALLLEQVDAGLARSVPAPMEPLLSLVSGDIR